MKRGDRNGERELAHPKVKTTQNNHILVQKCIRISPVITCAELKSGVQTRTNLPQVVRQLRENITQLMEFSPPLNADTYTSEHLMTNLYLQKSDFDESQVSFEQLNICIW